MHTLKRYKCTRVLGNKSSWGCRGAAIDHSVFDNEPYAFDNEMLLYEPPAGAGCLVRCASYCSLLLPSTSTAATMRVCVRQQLGLRNAYPRPCTWDIHLGLSSTLLYIFQIVIINGAQTLPQGTTTNHPLIIRIKDFYILQPFKFRSKSSTSLAHRVLQQKAPLLLWRWWIA